MTNPLPFGWTPIPITVILSWDADWIIQIEPQTSTPGSVLPDDTTVSLVIYPPGTDGLPPDEWPDPLDTWDATVDLTTDIVSWKVPSEQANLIPKMAYARLMLTYPIDDDYVWAKGLVARSD